MPGVKHPAALLAALSLCSAVGLWHLTRLNERLVRSTASDGAAQQAETLECLNDAYSEAVDRAMPKGKVLVTHDYATRRDALPLPAADHLSRQIHQRTKRVGNAGGAEALAEGFAPAPIADAINLAANKLLLNDPGREKDDGPDKPKGTVHGASVGPHASDAANAWRNIVRVSNHRNTVAELIVGAYHTAVQNGGQLTEQLSWPTDVNKNEVPGTT